MLNSKTLAHVLKIGKNIQSQKLEYILSGAKGAQESGKEGRKVCIVNWGHWIAPSIKMYIPWLAQDGGFKVLFFRIER